MELVQAIGFKTTGPPDWVWYTPKASILDKLRDKKPKSGLIITELALEKYKFINNQEQKKSELKKIFQQEKRAELVSVSKTTYLDKATGIECFLFETGPLLIEAQSFIKPKPPDAICFICGEPVYPYEYDDICLWCDKQQKNSS